MPVAIKNSELLRINFAKLRSQLKLIPSLILPSCSFYSINCSNIVRDLGTTNICSSFVYSLQKIYITKHNDNTLTHTININIVNSSTFILVTIFTSFSSVKGDILHDSIFIHSLFIYSSNYLPSSILPDPFINVITVPPKIWRTKAASKYKSVIYDDVDEDLFIKMFW